MTSAYLQLLKPVVILASEGPWATEYRIKAYPVDPRDQFRFTTDLTLRGKQALMALGPFSCSRGAGQQGRGMNPCTPKKKSISHAALSELIDFKKYFWGTNCPPKTWRYFSFEPFPWPV